MVSKDILGDNLARFVIQNFYYYGKERCSQKRKVYDVAGRDPGEEFVLILDCTRPTKCLTPEQLRNNDSFNCICRAKPSGSPSITRILYTL